MEFRGLLESKCGLLHMEEVSFKDKINYLSRAKALLKYRLGFRDELWLYEKWQGGTKLGKYGSYRLVLPIESEVVDKKTDHLEGF